MAPQVALGTVTQGGAEMAMHFEQKYRELVPSNTADDGSTVWPLCRLPDAVSTAIWRLEADQVSKAVRLSTLEEVWYVIAGSGSIWRRQDANEQVLELRVGVVLTIPKGTDFQFRAGEHGLEIFGVTVPPYPIGSTTEVQVIEGPWAPSSAATG